MYKGRDTCCCWIGWGAVPKGAAPEGVTAGDTMLFRGWFAGFCWSGDAKIIGYPYGGACGERNYIFLYFSTTYCSEKRNNGNFNPFLLETPDIRQYCETVTVPLVAGEHAEGKTVSKFRSQSRKLCDRLRQNYWQLNFHNTVCNGLFQLSYTVGRNMQWNMFKKNPRQNLSSCKLFLHQPPIAQHVLHVIWCMEKISLRKHTVYLKKIIITSYHLIPIGRWENRKVWIRREKLKIRQQKQTQN